MLTSPIVIDELLEFLLASGLTVTAKSLEAECAKLEAGPRLKLKSEDFGICKIPRLVRRYAYKQFKESQEIRIKCEELDKRISVFEQQSSKRQVDILELGKQCQRLLQFNLDVVSAIRDAICSCDFSNRGNFPVFEASPGCGSFGSGVSKDGKISSKPKTRPHSVTYSKNESIFPQNFFFQDLCYDPCWRQVTNSSSYAGSYLNGVKPGDDTLNGANPLFCRPGTKPVSDYNFHLPPIDEDKTTWQHSPALRTRDNIVQNERDAPLRSVGFFLDPLVFDARSQSFPSRPKLPPIRKGSEDRPGSQVPGIRAHSPSLIPNSYSPNELCFGCLDSEPERAKAKDHTKGASACQPVSVTKSSDIARLPRSNHLDRVSQESEYADSLDEEPEEQERMKESELMDRELGEENFPFVKKTDLAGAVNSQEREGEGTFVSDLETVVDTDCSDEGHEIPSSREFVWRESRESSSTTTGDLNNAVKQNVLIHVPSMGKPLTFADVRNACGETSQNQSCPDPARNDGFIAGSQNIDVLGKGFVGISDSELQLQGTEPKAQKYEFSKEESLATERRILARGESDSFPRAASSRNQGVSSVRLPEAKLKRHDRSRAVSRNELSAYRRDVSSRSKCNKLVEKPRKYPSDSSRSRVVSDANVNALTALKSGIVVDCSSYEPLSDVNSIDTCTTLQATGVMLSTTGGVNRWRPQMRLTASSKDCRVVRRPPRVSWKTNSRVCEYCNSEAGQQICCARGPRDSHQPVDSLVNVSEFTGLGHFKKAKLKARLRAPCKHSIGKTCLSLPLDINRSARTLKSPTSNFCKQHLKLQSVSESRKNETASDMLEKFPSRVVHKGRKHRRQRCEITSTKNGPILPSREHGAEMKVQSQEYSSHLSSEPISLECNGLSSFSRVLSRRCSPELRGNVSGEMCESKKDQMSRTSVENELGANRVILEAGAQSSAKNCYSKNGDIVETSLALDVEATLMAREILDEPDKYLVEASEVAKPNSAKMRENGLSVDEYKLAFGYRPKVARTPDIE